jgi:hypothetical protein
MTVRLQALGDHHHRCVYTCTLRTRYFEAGRSEWQQADLSAENSPSRVCMVSCANATHAGRDVLKHRLKGNHQLTVAIWKR